MVGGEWGKRTFLRWAAKEKLWLARRRKPRAWSRRRAHRVPTHSSVIAHQGHFHGVGAGRRAQYSLLTSGTEPMRPGLPWPSTQGDEDQDKRSGTRRENSVPPAGRDCALANTAAAVSAVVTNVAFTTRASPGTSSGTARSSTPSATHGVRLASGAVPGHRARLSPPAAA